jgi:hypothetical protein
MIAVQRQTQCDYSRLLGMYSLPTIYFLPTEGHEKIEFFRRVPGNFFTNLKTPKKNNTFK